MSKWTRANPLAAVPGYKVPPGHFANGYTNGGDRVGFKKGGKVRGSRDTEHNPHKEHRGPPRREKPKASDLWRRTKRTTDPQIQKKLDLINRLAPRRKHLKPTVAPRPNYKKGGKVEDKNWIQKAVNPKHKGFCTPMTKKTCTPRRKALEMTFKKMGKARKGK